MKASTSFVSQTCAATAGIGSSLWKSLPGEFPIQALGHLECAKGVVYAKVASFYPIQPDFNAGYTVAAQKLNSDTQDWAYVVTGDFPYS
jgi:hypothetical protein